MQSYALTVDKFMDHAGKWFGAHEVVTAEAGQAVRRIGYAGLRDRANRLSGALLALEAAPGQRIGTLAWNSQHHLEVYYAAMGMGVVCHTLNPRLTPEHLAVMVNEAEDRVLAVADSLEPMLDALLPLCPGVRAVILLDRDGRAPDRATLGTAEVFELETLLAERGRAIPWGRFDEETPAGLCYTSGTTGAPKGVLYSHRSNYLQTLRSIQADALGFTARDVALVAVPMFHANGWGIPFCAPATGARLILPGRHLDGASLARLLVEEEVTVAVGIQTVWLGVLDHLDATGGETPALERVVIGGSSCPDALIARLERRLGAVVQTSWGMTELAPMGTISPPRAGERAASGRPPVGLDMKLTDAEGVTLPEQRGVEGHLKVKGASVVDRYFKSDQYVIDSDGYFDTGDLARIDATGALTITGRSKDLIKSGGEWINPAEIEAIVGRLPSVALAAVVAREHPRWGERPILLVEPHRETRLDTADVMAALKGRVADWWLPDAVISVARMPLAPTGKIDKVKLRADYGAAAG